jgi:hypothetical protein
MTKINSKTKVDLKQIDWITTVIMNLGIFILNILSFVAQVMVPLIILFSYFVNRDNGTLMNLLGWFILFAPIIILNSFIYYFFKKILFVRFRLFR